MQNLLIVVDMQNDFIDGALGSPEAQAIVPFVQARLASFPPEQVFFTRDTHSADYLDTQEGQKLPVVHCQKDSPGWAIRAELDALRATEPFDKLTFGSWELGRTLRALDRKIPVDRVTFVGLCTDICVISNAMLIKAALPEARIIVDAAACAGSSPAAHATALTAMKNCQIEIVNETEV